VFLDGERRERPAGAKSEALLDEFGVQTIDSVAPRARMAACRRSRAGRASALVLRNR
jgi:hypothetical protein